MPSQPSYRTIRLWTLTKNIRSLFGNLEVYVWSGCPPCSPNLCNDLTALNPIADLHEVDPIVAIQHSAAIFGGNDDHVSKTPFRPTFYNHTIGDGFDVGSSRSRNVCTLVESQVLTDRIATPADRRRNDAIHRKSLRRGCRRNNGWRPNSRRGIVKLLLQLIIQR